MHFSKDGSANQSLSGAGKLDKIAAAGQVVITQPDRHATGDLLTYTASDDKFVLTGGPPSIFDAEHGQIAGVSLTFFRHDDRVLVRKVTLHHRHPNASGTINAYTGHRRNRQILFPTDRGLA